MTRTVHPYIHRVGIIKGWKSLWFFNDKNKYREAIKIDYIVRNYIEKKLKGKMLRDVNIQHKSTPKNLILSITIQTARPGLLIGKSGTGIKDLKTALEKELRRNKIDVPQIDIHVEELKFFELYAAPVADYIIESLNQRTPFRRVMKQTAEKVFANAKVKGIRISLSGRLGGAEIARSEYIRKGRVPLQTFRADVDYSEKKGIFSYGTIGVKVWIYKGKISKDNIKR